ncbi:MAG: hypothetical protein JWO03_857 [Bacteroidetes bacterium]|nr:hypothetical protein [Bacteroidota bacterium]
MKHGLLLLLAVCFALAVSAQGADTVRVHPLRQYVPQEELDKFNLRQMQINKRGLYTLSGWALGNVIYGSIAASLTRDEARYFHATNAIWGGINLVIAVPGVISSYNKARAMNVSYGRTILQQHGAEKLYLINGALDFAYIGAGAAMWGFSDRLNNIRTRQGVSGAGKAFMVQGAFLLFFDWSMYIVHSQHAYKNLNRYTAGLAFTGTGFSYNLQF